MAPERASPSTPSRAPSRALSPAPPTLSPAPSRARSPVPAWVLSPAPSMHTTPVEDTANAWHFEFLLFSYLLRFVHREGRTGDFARAGLLFLFDIAFLTGDEGGDALAMTPVGDGPDPLQDARDALAEYILDGDFADVMAAGLGAAYSVLPSKLRVPSLAEFARAEEMHDDPGVTSAGMHLGEEPKRGGGSGSEDSEDDEDADDGLPTSSDPDVRAQLDALLRLFGFLQDILYRCRSPLLHADPLARTVSTAQVLGPAVADSALDAVQTVFIDNVIYPSILECSKSDGSAVAVLTYLDVLLANLEDGPVLHRILDVLMDADRAAPAFTSPKKGKPRRSTGALDYVPSTPSTGHYVAEGERFTLRDLLLDNLRSSSSPSVAAALHLLQTLLADHCRRIAPSLLTLIRLPNATAIARPLLPPPSSEDWSNMLPVPVNSTDAHLQEPELYGALVPRLDDAVQMGIDTVAGFASYVTDAHAFLEADSCWLASRVPLQFVADDGNPALLRVGEYDADPLQHTLSPSDPLVQTVLAALRGWFTSAPDTNVALSGAISALIRCPHRSLAGWLLYDMTQPEPDPWADLSDADSDASRDAYRSKPASLGSSRDGDDLFASHTPTATLPALYQILRQLVRHEGRFRAAVDGFDRLLSERRQGLLFADHLEEAMGAIIDAPTPPMSPSPATLDTPRKKSATTALASSIRSLWSPRRKTPASTPTHSPAPSVGRNSPAPNTSALPAPAVAHLREASATSTSTLGSLGGSLFAGGGGGLGLTPGPESTSPFKNHYAHAAEAGMLPVSRVPPPTGPWAPRPARKGRASRAPNGTSLDADQTFDLTTPDGTFRHTDESDTDSDADTRPHPVPPSHASLSAVLDNCIVLEELVKELVAVITARRALGIDQVGFV